MPPPAAVAAAVAAVVAEAATAVAAAAGVSRTPAVSVFVEVPARTKRPVFKAAPFLARVSDFFYQCLSDLKQRSVVMMSAPLLPLRAQPRFRSCER